MWLFVVSFQLHFLWPFGTVSRFLHPCPPLSICWVHRPFSPYPAQAFHFAVPVSLLCSTCRPCLVGCLYWCCSHTFAGMLSGTYILSVPHAFFRFLPCVGLLSGSNFAAGAVALHVCSFLLLCFVATSAGCWRSLWTAMPPATLFSLMWLSWWSCTAMPFLPSSSSGLCCFPFAAMSAQVVVG